MKREDYIKEEYQDLLSKYLGSTSAALLTPERAQKLSVEETVRSGFRDSSFLVPEKERHEVGLDVGFLALKELSNKERWGEALGVVANSRVSSDELLSVEAPGSSGWAGPLDYSQALQPGTFLLSHPMLGDYFSRTVILISDHDEHTQTQGFILNRPSQLSAFSSTVASAFKSAGLPSAAVPLFNDESVLIGGPRSMTDYNPETRIRMIHRQSSSDDSSLSLGGRVIPNLSGNVGVDKAVYVDADIPGAIVAVSEGMLEKEDVLFSTNVSYWTAGQLETELERGFWIPCGVDAADVLFEGGDNNGDLWERVMREVGYGEFCEIDERAKIRVGGDDLGGEADVPQLDCPSDIHICD